MSTPLLCVLLFGAWTALLVLTIGLWRAVLVLRGRPANDFSPAGGDHTRAYDRLIRVHLNCVENLPPFAAVVLALEVAGLGDGVLGTLAMVLVAARVCQSLVHLASTSSMAVQVRFTFFLTQQVALGVMVVRGLSAAMD